MRADGHQSQTLKAILGLRGMVLNGVLKPGERVSELLVADRLGISRTPAAKALIQLREEGLLDSLPAGGFVVAKFSQLDAYDALELRGTLEALAARLGAERGVPAAITDRMQRCADQIDAIIAGWEPGADLSEHIRCNDEFHDLLLQCTQSTIIRRSLERIKSLPFAAPNPFTKDLMAQSPNLRFQLMLANDQHHSIVDAIRNREGARAAALTLEHARSAWKHMRATALEPLFTYNRP
jgi:GntR family transcriptional regulator of vanillate catabolism